MGASQPVSDAIFAVRRREEGITTGGRDPQPGIESGVGALRLDARGRVARRCEFPSGGQRADLLLIDQAFPAADTSDFVGSVRCDAVGEERFSAVALEMDPGTRVFTTLPVFPVPEMQ